MEPATVLVRAFQVHDFVLAAVADAPDAGKAGEMLRVFQNEGVCGA